MFDLNPDRKTRGRLHEYAQRKFWKKRGAKVIAEAVRQIAEAVGTAVVGRIPTSSEWRSYRKSLQLVRVSSRDPTFAIRADPRGAVVEPVDADRTVLYVRRNASYKGKKHPEIDVLTKFNPWTAATLPLKPNGKEATLVSRRVTPREVRAIAKKRKADRIAWARELQRCGVKQRTRPSRDRVMKHATALPDLGFNALRLEFGYGGVTPTPHWRPSIYDVVSSAQKFLGTKAFRRALTDPKYRAWKQWPGPVYGTISEDEARKYADFQKRLNLSF